MSTNNLYDLVEEKFKLNDQWKIITYKTYIDYINKNISDEHNDISYLIKYAQKNPHRDSFKFNCEVGSSQFLVGIFPKENVIRIASKQLCNELTLIDFSEAYEIPEIKEIKEHSELIASIPLKNTPTVIEFISCKHELPLFNEGQFEQVHLISSKLSAQLVGKIGMYRQSLFEKFSDFGLDLTANYMLIRIHLLKFLAILPNLNHDKKGLEVKRIFLETLRRLIHDSELAKFKNLKGQKKSLPAIYIIVCRALLAVSNIIPPKVLATILRFSVGVMAKRFIAGENIENAKTSLDGILLSGRDATIDQLGELVVSNKEADEYTEKVLEIIKGLGQSITKGDRNSAQINKAHVSIKVSALCNDFKPQSFESTYENIAPRLRKILICAKEHKVFINIDAEHYHFRDIIFDVYKKVLLTCEELKDYRDTGIVVQAYLRDGYEHFLEIVNLAKERGILMPIRLVKGAYWDAETIEADAHNFTAPQFLNKEETDIHFRQIIFKSLEYFEYIQLAIASHNIQDHCFAEALKENRFPAAPVIEHQCLHMTYEGLSVGMAKMNWPTRNYIPVGNLLVGMAYLVRRIMENSSQVGVLTIMRSHKKGLNVKVPTQVLQGKKIKQDILYDKSISSLTRDFSNIYPIRTYKKNHLERVKSQINHDLSEIKNNRTFSSIGDIPVICSSDESLTLGHIKYDDAGFVDKKIESLFKGFNESDWAHNNSISRYSSLIKLADLMLFNREELTSLIMLEAGKTIDESIADVDEAIDFIHFYLREQIHLNKEYKYSARGVVGVIAPWNFPLAIACGMTVSALCAGNSVILKPAEQTPLIAQKFIELCYMAGIPENILKMTLGEASVGQAIVNHELIVGIVFTGSKAVGESIYSKISREVTSTRYSYDPIPKFAITEMGGKNAIIVTNNSELDETVSGIIYAAFAHSGQKCSAASRIIIDKQLKDAFVERFSNAVNDLSIGRSYDFSTVVNPLISKEDELRVKEMSATAKAETLKLGGRVIVDKSQEEFPGYCVGPSVFELSSSAVLNNETIASKEVFGPLIHLITYDDLDEAIHIFNSTEYALTGGVFCQSQDDLDYLLPKLDAGNLYINRPNTGARVAIEPFGGFKMSGTGPKAGGKAYMPIFNRSLKVNLSNDHEFNNETIEVKSDMAHDSKLTQERRSFNLKKLIHEIIEQYGTFFGHVVEKDKNTLASLSTALAQNEFNLFEKHFPNRDIPGQISYTKKDYSIGSGIFVETNINLNIDTLVELLVNLIIGNGINIVTSNQDIFNTWDSIVKLAYKNGISKYNLTVSLATKESITSLLEQEQYSFVLFTNKKIDDGFKTIIYNRSFKQHLVKVFTSGQFEDWSQCVESFTKSRSFAINTMRHGAPLELTI